MQRTVKSVAATKESLESYSDSVLTMIIFKKYLTYNVLFYFLNSDEEYYLSVVTGVGEYRYRAYNYAEKKSLIDNVEWSHACCLKRKILNVTRSIINI